MKVPRSCSRFRLSLAALAWVAGCMSASATMTLVFSRTTAQATNWGNSDDAGGEALTWGVLIDTTGNGFSATYAPGSVNYLLTGIAQSLPTAGGAATDDILFLMNTPMSILTAMNATDGAVAGMNRAFAVSNVPTAFGINIGDPFMLVWFDRTQGGAVTPADTAAAGDRFGVYADASFLIPQDAETRSYADPFTGPDPLKLMNRSFVPEPSTALLSLLGAAGLVRHRPRR